MTIAIYQNILRLQIPIQYLFAVQVFDCREDLRRVEKNLSLSESALFLQVVEEGATTFEV